jgi:hypothetical protein
MARFTVKCSETRRYETSYSVECSSKEEARDLVCGGAGIEVDDEFIETTDRTVLSVKQSPPEDDVQ